MIKNLRFLLLHLTMMSAGAFALPPERPAHPTIDNMYVEGSGTLVAGTVADGFFRSVDDGRHWTGMAPPSGKHKGIALDVERQMCHMEDRGESWKCLGSPHRVQAVDAAGNMYKCDGKRVAISGAGGGHWKNTAPWASSSAAGATCGPIAVNGDQIYVLAGETLYGSSDRGKHWMPGRRAREATQRFNNEVVQGLMTDRRGKIYAMTEASGTRYQHIFSTADAGASWRRETFGLPANWHYFVLRRIFGDATYFSAMPSEIATDAFEPPLYRSVGGKNAVPMNIKIKIGEWSDVQVGPDGAVYVVASSLIHKSGDGGKTWRALSRVGID